MIRTYGPAEGFTQPLVHACGACGSTSTQYAVRRAEAATSCLRLPLGLYLLPHRLYVLAHHLHELVERLLGRKLYALAVLQSLERMTGAGVVGLSCAHHL